MAEYQLSPLPGVIIRTSDNAFIPSDERNADYRDYQAWLAKGNAPDAYAAPPEPVPPEPSTGQSVLYEHENRIRALEGQPPLTLVDFVTLMRK